MEVFSITKMKIREKLNKANRKSYLLILKSY